MTGGQPIFVSCRRAIAFGLLLAMSLWLSGLAPAWHMATAHDPAKHHHAEDQNRDRHRQDHDDHDHDGCRICDLAHACWVSSDESLDLSRWTDLPIGRLAIESQHPAHLAYISFALARDPPLK